MTNLDNHSEARNLLQQLTKSEKHWQQKQQLDQREETQAEIFSDKLWIQLSEMYGSQFVRQYGSTPPDAWVKCLKGITGRQIANALNTCLEECSEWPPNAPKFRAMCLGIVTDSKGKELAHAAGMYSLERTEEVINYDSQGKVLGITKQAKPVEHESDRAKAKKSAIGRSALDGILGDLAGVSGTKAVNKAKTDQEPKEPCTACNAVFEAVLNKCPKCEVER